MGGDSEGGEHGDAITGVRAGHARVSRHNHDARRRRGRRQLRIRAPVRTLGNKEEEAMMGEVRHVGGDREGGSTVAQ